MKTKYNTLVKEEDIDYSDIPPLGDDSHKWVKSKIRREAFMKKAKDAQEKIRFNSDNPIKGNSIEVE